MRPFTPAARATSSTVLVRVTSPWSASTLALEPRLQTLRDVFSGGPEAVTAQSLRKLLDAARQDPVTPQAIDPLESATVSLLWDERDHAPSGGGATPEARALFEENVNSGFLMDVESARELAKAMTPSPALTGRAFTAAVLAQVRQQSASGVHPRVVFDIDDTLTDSRARTLAFAKAYDHQHGTTRFSGLCLADIQFPPTELAQKAGLSGADLNDFMSGWEDYFFSIPAMKEDEPIAPMVELAKEAAAAGAEVVFLTGRPEEQRSETLSELERLKLPQSLTDHLFMSKPGDKADFKVKLLSQWAKAGQALGFFITESTADVARLQAAGSPIAPVLFESPLKQAGEPRAGTPVYAWEADKG